MTHYKTMTKLMISQTKKKQQQYCVDLLECTTTKSQNTPEGNQPQDTFRLKLILVSLFALHIFQQIILKQVAWTIIGSFLLFIL